MRSYLFKAGESVGRQIAEASPEQRELLERRARAEVTHPDFVAGLEAGLAEAVDPSARPLEAAVRSRRPEPTRNASRPSGERSFWRSPYVIALVSFLAPGAGCITCGLVSGRLMPGTDPDLAAGAARRWVEDNGCSIRIYGSPCLGWQCYTVRCSNGWSGTLRCSETACARGAPD